LKSSARIPDNWRDRLPDPAAYYAQRVAKLGSANGKGWAQGLCPFHEDHAPSLSVHVADGGAYRCMACGAKGRDVVAFHMARNGYGFKEAVRDLIGLEARA
jgi:DNA primase